MKQPTSTLTSIWDCTGTAEKQLNEIIGHISDCYNIRKGRRQKDCKKYYDTFDWRLLNNKHECYQIHNQYFLQSLNRNTAPHSSPDKKASPYKFWWDFPEGKFANQLKKYTDIRALIPILTIETASLPFSVLNNDEKTVARVSIHKSKIYKERDHSKSVKYLEVQAIRGYTKAYQSAVNTLNRYKLQKINVYTLSWALDLLDIHPGRTRPVSEITLHGEMPAREAVKNILLDLLKNIRKNEEGIIKDIDTEFLHDYRVSLRRTRAMLTQMKGIFPQAKVIYFKDQFSKLQKKTNRLRDIDVYLLNKSVYRNYLPPELQDGLDSFFYDLSKERIAVHDTVCRKLQQKQYVKLMESWYLFLTNPTLEKTKNAEKPILDLAKRYIRTRYQKIEKAAPSIHASSPDSALHNLRIECKKLRYLLEFFKPLFPAGPMRSMIKQLKQLQDTLGIYNDLSIQQLDLKEYLSQMEQKSRPSIQVVTGIGGLITQFYKEQQEVHSSFTQVIQQFLIEKNQYHYQQLFGK